MGVYDMIDGAPEGYDNQVKCWSYEELALRFRGMDDAVPDIEGHTTYSVRYNAERTMEARFWHVRNGLIGAINENKPQPGYPVFDKWGGRA